MIVVYKNILAGEKVAHQKQDFVIGVLEIQDIYKETLFSHNTLLKDGVFSTSRWSDGQKLR